MGLGFEKPAMVSEVKREDTAPAATTPAPAAPSLKK